MKILIIEDNQRLAENIATFLKTENITTTIALDGHEGYKQASNQFFDAIILDLTLPSMDGHEICQKLRQNGIETPILMLTARSSLDDKITGLNLGANDYIAKPFNLEELLARINAQTRNASVQTKILEIKNIKIDFAKKEIRKNNKIIQLSPKEYGILEFLAKHKGFTKNRTEILGNVWGNLGYEINWNSDTVEVHISYLRKKLGSDIIQTKKGFGYVIQ